MTRAELRKLQHDELKYETLSIAFGVLSMVLAFHCNNLKRQRVK